MTVVQHSSRSNNWGTPLDVVESARVVLGSIDLDPASSKRWNKDIRASQIYTARDDGLTKPWRGSVFANPPGGRGGGIASLALAFWLKLLEEIELGNCDHAIFVGFQIGILQISQFSDVPGTACLDYPCCIPSKRLAFRDGDEGRRNQPAHANAIIYIPGVQDASEVFRREFRKFGRVA